MLAKRLAVTGIILPLGLLVIFLGGWPFQLTVIGILLTSGYEYYMLFKNGGYAPSAFLLLSGILILALFRIFFGFQYTDILLSLFILISIFVHILDYERGMEKSATDFCITLTGILYIGWLGSYFVSLRNLPGGLWWILLVLPAIWIADAAAYFVGKRFGKHALSPLVSPKKTWEGYLGGIAAAALLTPLLAVGWNHFLPEITPIHGLVIAITISVLAPAGDLAESLFKRQFRIKDSSHLMPGHGGAFDRVDSWLWAVVIGYYLVKGLWLH